MVFDGRLDNRVELIGALKAIADVSATTEDAWLAAWCYEAHGAAFVSRLAGDFALAVIHAAAATVLLARDVIASAAVFHPVRCVSAFASEVKPLLTIPGVRARPNDRLLAELMLRRLHRAITMARRCLPAFRPCLLHTSWRSRRRAPTCGAIGISMPRPPRAARHSMRAPRGCATTSSEPSRGGCAARGLRRSR